MFDIEIYVDEAGAWRFRMVGFNHEKIGDNYTQLHSAKEGVTLVKQGAASAKVYLVDADGGREEVSL